MPETQEAGLESDDRLQQREENPDEGNGIPITGHIQEGVKTDQEKDRQDKEQADGVMIPERPKDALTGTQFGERLLEMEAKLKQEGKNPDEIRKQRELEIYNQIKSGNIPSQLRKFQSVEVNYKDKEGNTISGSIKVMPDYLMIGSDEDAVRVPMTPATAQLIARQWGCSLPTDTMVDQIAKQADIKLTPIAKPPGAVMMSTGYFLDHNEQIDRQLAGKSREGKLIAGDKKDIILPYMKEGDKHVIIYGWHYANGKRIQPYSGGAHEDTYADYSHGVRLVAGIMDIEVNGQKQKIKVSDALQDPTLHHLIARQMIKDPDHSYPGNRWQKDWESAEKYSILVAPQGKSTGTGVQIEPPSSSAAAPSSEPPSSSAAAPSSEPPSSSAAAPSSEPLSLSAALPPNVDPPIRGAADNPDDLDIQTSSGQPSTALGPDLEQTQKPVEGVEAEPPMPTNTGFFGDSITTFLPFDLCSKNGNKRMAKGGETTSWLLREVTSRKAEFGSLEKAVTLIGTNDIGAMDPPGTEEKDCKWSSKAIFERIEKIWQTMKDANPNIQIYACTIPPFKGHTYAAYKTHFDEVNQKRIEINEMIKNSSIPTNIIDLCKPVSDGRLASVADDKEAILDYSVRAPNDPVHVKGEALAKVYKTALAS